MAPAQRDSEGDRRKQSAAVPCTFAETQAKQFVSMSLRRAAIVDLPRGRQSQRLELTGSQPHGGYASENGVGCDRRCHMGISLHAAVVASPRRGIEAESGSVHEKGAAWNGRPGSDESGPDYP